jgi:hypothetical protein
LAKLAIKFCGNIFLYFYCPASKADYWGKSHEMVKELLAKKNKEWDGGDENFCCECEFFQIDTFCMLFYRKIGKH